MADRIAELAPLRLQAYRRITFRLQADGRVRTIDDARVFVAERGFVYFWPITGVNLPSLWAAVAGDRPVADAHDDPGHVTWGWKDRSLDQRWWYYAKLLRGKATLIALAEAPNFYALSENYGDPDHDYLEQYRDGRLSHEAKLIYEALLEHGPLDTVTLRGKIRMTSKASNSPFDRALAALQRDFKILPVGVAQTGAWRYSFIYECVHRWYPDLPERARAITRRQARARLAELYLRSLGAVSAADLRALFQWPRKEIDTAMTDLVAGGRARAGYRLPETQDECLVMPELVA